MSKIILEMKNIKKSFSGVHALNGIDFSLEQGEVHALLGENGAGKSTLIKVLGGIYQPDHGSIYIEGTMVKIDKVQTARELGIGIIHQEIVLVPYLSVAQNIFLGREPVTTLGTVDSRKMVKRAHEMVADLGLDIDVRIPVEELTIAQQQMVEIVKAISFDARILVMDEPTSSLSDEEVVKLFETIERLKEQKVSIIYISHRMEELFRISHRITVIRDGEYVGTQITSETNVSELVSMMVGRTLDNFYIREYNDLENAETVLKVENLNSRGAFSDINFKVRRGEVLGFAGLVGAGRSEIMMSIFGCKPYWTSGKVFLNGESVRFRNSLEAINKGIGFVPEDRKKQGLILNNTVGYNISIASLKYIMSGFSISKKKRAENIQNYIKKLQIKTYSQDTSVVNLSGGNQQKVVLAKWLATKPSLLILDEPTRGVDVGAKYEIYNIINQLAAEGIAVIFISSELPEVINMCDSVCVVKEGKVVKQLEKSELSQENIMYLAAGGKEKNE